MANYKVGDKVRYVRGVWFRVGEELYINKIDRDDGDYLLGPEKGMSEDNIHALWVEENEFELGEESTDEIEELKRRVSELAAKVKRLESVRRTVELLADPVKFALTYAEGREEKTANERRKEAIEKAKKFVYETEREAQSFFKGSGGNYTYRNRKTRPEFIVNEEKRTVVALVKGAYNRKLVEKGIAKCAPSDVFNVHIGKAIALGRAYGLDVSEFEQAPQPDEVVPGMVVEDIDAPPYKYEVAKIIDDISEIVGYDGEKHGTPFRVKADSGWLGSKQVRIISDSEAQY